MTAAVHARLRRALPGGFVLLAACAVYLNSIANGFALDDQWIIASNEAVHGIEHMWDAITQPYWSSAPGRIGLYRPLTTALYAVEWTVWGGDPTGYHVVNVLLHGAASLLVFLLLRRLGASRIASAFGGLLFAVHPVHTEAVANVVGRAELLAAFFFLGACLIYLRRSWPWALRAAGVGGCYFLALGAKEIAATLPAVLLLIEAASAPGETAGPLRGRLRRQAPVFAALALAATVYGGIRFAVLGDPMGNDVAPSLAGQPTFERLLSAVRVWPEYVRLLFFPRELVADYSPGVIMSPDGFEPIVLLGLAVGAGALLLAVAAWRRARFASVGVLWFAITILPVSNLLVPIGVLLAERTLYLPSVGLALLGAAAVPYVRSARPQFRRIAAAAAIFVLVTAGWWTWQRNPVWRSTETVLQDLVRDHPESFRSQWLIGASLVRENRITEGLLRYRRAVELAPDHYSLLLSYGQRLLAADRPGEAEPLLRRAAELIPEDRKARVLLAESMLLQERYKDAVEAARAALQVHEHDPALYYQLARAYAGLEDWLRAGRAQRARLRIVGGETHWAEWAYLARLELQSGRPAAAAETLERARRLAPEAKRPALVLDSLVASVEQSAW